MIKFSNLIGSVLFVISLYSPRLAFAQNPASTASKTILEMREGVEKRLAPTSDQVTFVRSPEPSAPGIVASIKPGKEDYPGIRIRPEGASWNLSAFGHVEARVVNTGSKPLSLALRVDNAGDWHDNPWNTESITLEPGASGTVTTIFGHSYGHKPGFALKSGAVVNILLFTGKSESVQSFRIESVAAGGPAGEKPPVAPEDVRVKPEGGLLLGIPTHDRTKIFSHGAQAMLTGNEAVEGMSIVFPASQNDSSVSYMPAVGRWDLRDYLEVKVEVLNEGNIPVTPRVRLESNGGASDWVTASAPLPPMAKTVITVPFAGMTPANPGKRGSGSQITNDAVSAITFAAGRAEREQQLRVDSIRAVLSPLPKLPEWLGKRPPVPGDWVKTLDDEFNGNKLDTSLWSVYGENYWDKTSHWSKDNVLIGGGVVKLRYEKKKGFNNDDPKQKPSDYASGYLHTFDRWAQRYGYFEARMKLPKSPGLWPAFWMMPDRGAAAGPKRQDTSDGGMEFDIMEHLTRWGPNRYNIAMHYDGYGKEHKSLGSDKIYVQPDKDGFLTCGLLWTPGSAIYYCNGQEVYRWEDARISNVPEILMFTLPMGGWDNSPLEDARLPDEFVIDYVRVWQRKDLASPGDGKKAPPKTSP